MKKRLALPLFIISLASMVITAFHNYILSDGATVIADNGVIPSVLIFLLALSWVQYSWSMRKQGMLA